MKQPDIAQILVGAEPQLQAVAGAARALILELHTSAVEIVWPRQRIASYGVGPRKMTEHCACIALHSKHVNLGFYAGATLDDPAGLLEGSGKQLRHVKLYALADARRPALRALIGAARSALAGADAWPNEEAPVGAAPAPKPDPGG